jgi:diketogulonate reductase-like aldo/keto reductase
VLYNLDRRGIEYDLLPWCAERAIPIMAYSPLARGRLLGHPALRAIAVRHDATPAQVALAWLLRHERLAAIPRAATPAHVRENAGALELELDAHAFAELDDAFPPPVGPRPLAML